MRGIQERTARVIQDAEFIGFNSDHNIGLPKCEVPVVHIPFFQFYDHDRFTQNPASDHLNAVNDERKTGTSIVGTKAVIRMPGEGNALPMLFAGAALTMGLLLLVIADETPVGN